MSGGKWVIDADEFSLVIPETVCSGADDGPGDGEGGAISMLRWANWSSLLGVKTSFLFTSFSPKHATLKSSQQLTCFFF